MPALRVRYQDRRLLYIEGLARLADRDLDQLRFVVVFAGNFELTTTAGPAERRRIDRRDRFVAGA